MDKLHKIIYSDKEIVFELEYKDIKNLNLRIKPDMSIHVSAPKKAKLDRIYDFVKAKGNWIIKRLKSFKVTKSEEKVKREYVSGESLKFLGRQYRLKIDIAQKDESIDIEDQYIVIKTKKNAKIVHKRNLYDKWLRYQANQIYNKALDDVYSLMVSEIITKPTIEFKHMTKRWGSCLRSKNTILLNLELVKAPRHCIEYVVLHELIHFVYKNHNKSFYNKLTVLMPDWKQRKEILDEEIVLFV